MYKIYTRLWCRQPGYTKQFLRVMKILLILMTAFLMQVSASTFAQKITLNEKEASLVSIFEKINKQSGVDFLVNIELLSKAKPVSINVNDEELAIVLDKIFKGQPLEYSIKDKAVVVTKKTPSFLERLADRWAAIDVHGRVVDQEGKPLPGATVKIKSTGRTVSTNVNGRFELKGVEEGAVLVVSFIGYVGKEVVAKRDMGDVVLEASDSKLDEVQVIAYGTTSKRLTTGNIGGIKTKDIETQPVTNPLLALQGRTPGVFINQNTGYANGGVTVRIQGQNSISYGNDPFYVIDGVPFASQVLPTRSNILGNSGVSQGLVSDVGSGNPLNFLNPAEIESIEVLKDADATAIYGSRAANGAILITTKKGKTGQTKVDFTLQSGIGKVGHKMKLLNTKQYLEMRREAYTNDGLSIPTSSSNKDFSNYDLTVFDQNRYTDWQKELLGGTANYTDAQLSVSGGTVNTTFRINGSYHRQTTVLPADFADKKGSLGVSIDHTSSNNKFKLSFSGIYQNDNNRILNADITSTILALPPNAPALRNADRTLNWNRIEINPLTLDSISTWTNPLSYFENTYQIKTSNLISNLNLLYILAKGLTIKTSLGYTDMITTEVARGPLSSFAPEERPNRNRYGSYSDGRVKSWIIEPQLTYNTNIVGGQASFLLGTTFQQNTNSLRAITGQGYNSDDVIDNFQAAYILSAAATMQSLYKYNAIFGRFNYNWQEKYILNLTARRDGSSRFGKANQFQNFGAVGAAWLFSNEDFIKNNLPFLSFGKLRGSYGTTGSDQIGNYTYLNLYSNITPAVPYQGFTGLIPNGLPNPYLQWELTKKLQGGIDLGFKNDKILFNVNYYRNRSSNQLLGYSLPTQTGFGDLLQNFPAKLENRGWEFTLTTTNLQNKVFTWTSSFNLTISRNKLLEFPGLDASSYASRLIIGKPINIQKRFDFAGVNLETGVNEYHTVDGKTVTAPVGQDLYVPVDWSPRFYGGFQNSLNYKNLKLDFLFQFVKQDAQNLATGFGYVLGAINNQPVEVLDRWQKPGDQTTIRKFSNSLPDFYVNSSTLTSRDASYIRLKNVSLSYDFPAPWTKAVRLDRCRVFAQGQNLLTFTNYIGLDPETPANGTIPPLRVITFGLQVTL
jgi:TonB-linked SusC/RagA family outer membrane protein